MTDQDLKEWLVLWKQYNNGYHMEPTDKQELVRLNHLIMEVCHKIHNNNMIGDLQR